VARSAGAVIGAYLVFTISAVVLFRISGRSPEAWPGVPFAAFSIIYGAVFGTLAGFLAARLAPRAPMGHAIVVAVLLAVAAILSLVLQFGEVSPWSNVATLFVFAPSAVLGGYLWQRQIER
jgi:hypothetical protein